MTQDGEEALEIFKPDIIRFFFLMKKGECWEYSWRYAKLCMIWRSGFSPNITTWDHIMNDGKFRTDIRKYLLPHDIVMATNFGGFKRRLEKFMGEKTPGICPAELTCLSTLYLFNTSPSLQLLKKGKILFSLFSWVPFRTYNTVVIVRFFFYENADIILRKQKMNSESKKQLNIIVLGTAFMFMFTAFQTCGNVAQTVITNLNQTDFHGSGYTRIVAFNSMAVIYGVFSASNLISPSVVAIIGPQLSMFISGIFYSIYIAIFIQPSTWTFYTASVFLGIAAAVLWTAQGNCLTINSDENTIGRNSGIFWALLQSSLFFGNLYIYFAWQGKTHISESDRRTVFIALTVISLVGTVLFFLIRTPEESKSEEDETTSDNFREHTSGQSKMTKAVDAFKRSIKLCGTKEILLLSITTAYTGLELTFFSGVYGTCIGAVNKFGTEEKSLIGLSGIFIGIGEILGGGIFGLLSKNNRFGRNSVVMLGIVVHFVAFYLIFYNIPNDAPIASIHGTDSVAFMEPSKEVAIFCSFLLGLGDSCFNTQLLSILGFLYSENSAPAFAIFKFIQVCCVAEKGDPIRVYPRHAHFEFSGAVFQSVCAAIAFFYSNYLLLQWQLLIMAVVGFFGTLSFFTVEWKAPAFVSKASDYSSI
ncbi:UNC93-like protein MFSD11 [Varanus komodoensis]|nr:UNC93-like protein MFSD11 [Varanus komodoensis]